MKRLGMFLIVAGMAAPGCGQRVERFEPGEQIEAPTRSKIPPMGAQRSAFPERGKGAPPLASSADLIRGTIVLAPHLVEKAPADAVLFLVARTAATGPPMAVKRIPSPRFPLEFSIGPDDRMMKSRPFEGEIHLSARVDADGNAMTRAPGDLQSTAQDRYSPGDSGIRLVVDEALPAP